LPEDTITAVTDAPAAPAPAAEPAEPQKPAGPYLWTTGRRKTAVARVRMRPGSGQIIVNGHKLNEFFKVGRMAARAVAPLKVADMMGKLDIIADCNGGGITGQSDAVMMGIARGLIKMKPELAKLLRDLGYLTRDARKVERKKYGRPGARKRFQFSKR
jgi:small subunit ribosomal protein S9